MRGEGIELITERRQFTAPITRAKLLEDINTWNGDKLLTPVQLRSKRIFDVILAAVLIAILAPLLLLISVLIKVTSKGPVLFRQPRVGYLDQIFVCLKFRSMYDDAQDLLCDTQTQPGDARVTPVGRWLRRLSLDELPQLFNVIRGDMSLVGPRPHAPATKAGDVPFHLAIDNYSSRHRVLPGITGLAQIRGFRGRTVTVEDIRRRVELDLEYIQRWSIMTDFKILAQTVVHLTTSSKDVI
ncbi:MAG: sugar transferase [Acetobacteraceae bacterium]|nr:sugar transferase [Acetobacteraceae bacterium]